MAEHGTSEKLRDVLNRANLPTLYGRFVEQKLDENSILYLSDDELTRIGVSTIGERIRLRDAAKNLNVVNETVFPGQSVAAGAASRLFPGFRSRSLQPTSTTRTKKEKKEAAWTGNFLCLSSRNQTRTPNSCEKEILSKTGLGLQKVRLKINSPEEEVMTSLQETFPKLDIDAGFELLRTQQNGRGLVAITPPWTSKNLKTNVGPQARIYIRPIQKDLVIDVQNEEVFGSTISVRCQHCGMQQYMDKLREHLAICTTDALAEELNINQFDNGFIQRNESDPDSQSESVLENVLVQEFNTVEVMYTHDLTLSTELVNVTKSTKVKDCIDYCRANQVSNPVEMLRKAQNSLVEGRPLDVVDTDSAIEGDTFFITINRDKVLETAFEELHNAPEEELKKTLEVQFYGEMAADYGGPRKEFFRLALIAIKEKYFDSGIRELLAADYKTVGVIFALSILQNGRTPVFLAPEMIQEIFSRTPPTSEAIRYLREGLDVLGVWELFIELPEMQFLLHPSSNVMTVKKLTTLLKPHFSEQGSNSIMYEKDIYSVFIKYLREVAAGRRGHLTLGSVLVFVSSTDEEPLLGFFIHPSITFMEASSAEGFIPTSSTCVNSLKLPRATPTIQRPDQDHLFQLYDYAFSNLYYGLQ